MKHVRFFDITECPWTDEDRAIWDGLSRRGISCAYSIHQSFNGELERRDYWTMKLLADTRPDEYSVRRDHAGTLIPPAKCMVF